MSVVSEKSAIVMSGRDTFTPDHANTEPYERAVKVERVEERVVPVVCDAVLHFRHYEAVGW